MDVSDLLPGLDRMLEKYYGRDAKEDPDSQAYRMGKSVTYSAYLLIRLSPYLAIAGAFSVFVGVIVAVLKTVHGSIPVQYALLALFGVGLFIGWWLIFWYGQHRLRKEMAQRERLFRQFIDAVKEHRERYPEARIEVVDSVAEALRDTEANARQKMARQQEARHDHPPRRTRSDLRC